MNRIRVSLLGLTLAACAPSSPPGNGKLTLPAEWRNAGGFPTSSATRDLKGWWTSFDDPQLTLLIRRALERNPDLRSAVAAVRQAKAQRKATASSLLPTLGYSGSRDSSKVWNRKSEDSSSTSYSAGLSASWELDFFSRNRQATAAAEADASAAEAELNAARASLAAETALAYLQLRAAEAGLDIVRESIGAQEETTQIAEWRARTGVIDGLELDQSKAALESARATTASLEQSVSQSRNRLNLLAGEVPGALDIPASRVLPQPGRALVVGIPADTIRQRPDVRAAGDRWLAAVARTQSAKAEQFPSIALTGSLGIHSLGSAKRFTPESMAVNLIAGLTGPIFDGGRIRANIEVQDAAEEQAYEGYRGSILTALSEVEDALIACRQTGVQIAGLEKAEASARSAAELAARKYKAGVIDITQVLDTQRSQLSTERELLTARLDRASAHVELYRALGGGW